MAWIAVDFDGTLAKYGPGQSWNDPEPVPAMVERVLRWLEEGKEVRIFTARVSFDPAGHERRIVEEFSRRHLGRVLAVTCHKDYGMIELWDDRAMRVITNTGRTCCGH